MKKILLLIFLLSAGLTLVNAQTSELEELLFNLPDVVFKEIESQNSGVVTYELKVRQPLDHSNPEKGCFYQKVYLSHKGFDLPTVIVTQGYQVNQNRQQEITNLLNANQINVEHRFFGESMPDSLDYDYLNLQQATADYHHIRQLFDQIYPQKWISTGISKGGATTIFYRYFYPNDVDVSVPYVAPINKSYEEQRIYKFLDTIGTDDCRDKIRAFQIRILENREQIMPLVKFFSIGARIKYSYLSLGEAFEYAVMEFPFAFWQYGFSCDDMPAETASIEEITEHFLAVSDISFFSDRDIRRYSSHYYQSATEMGYYGYETSEFKDYLTELPTDTNPMCLFFPFEMTDDFNGQLLNDVNDWLETEADKFIYIYGANDTWSASAVPQNDKVDSQWFFMKGKHHGNARIREMSDDEQERLISTLEKWLALEIEYTLPE